MMKIKAILIAGHQYPEGNPGAVIPETTEARQNVETVDELFELLKFSEFINPIKAPHDIGGEKEIQFANDASDETSIIIAIHCNAGSASGAEAFYYPGNERTKRIAEIIVQKIGETTKIPSRGAKPDTQSQCKSGLGIIRKTKADAVLVEIGFLTTDPDKTMILDPNKDNLFSEAIFEALEEIFRPKTIEDESARRILDELIEAEKGAERMLESIRISKDIIKKIYKL